MSPTKEQRLLACVTATKERADTIWRRYAGVPDHKSLAHSLRRQRSDTGKQLERMAARGLICRGVGVEDGHVVSLFWRES